MLRSLPKISASSASFCRALPTRTSRFFAPAAFSSGSNTSTQKRLASSEAAQHAISNPTLAGIEKRWEAMPPQEQADLWMALRDRMKVDWHELTLQEKKAAYFVAFGPHGPRALDPPGEGWRVFTYTMIGVAVSGVIFALIRSQAREGPKTMNKEYQEQTNEYLRAQNNEPITGLSAPDYVGKGQVQSPSVKPQ